MTPDSPTLNPYWNRTAIDDPRSFFGRAKERYYLTQLIQRGQPVSITGQRRIGKSSLLRTLRFPDLRDWAEPMRLISLDGSYFQDAEEQSFLRYLLDELQEALGIAELPTRRESLLEAARTAKGLGIQLVLLIDEFDVIAYNTRISGGKLFSFLRALVQEFRCP